jgi:hypothetical protein
MGGLVCHELRVPLDAEDETVLGTLHCLNDPVRRPGHRAQAPTYVCNRLVMEAVHAKSALAGDRRQKAGGLDFHAMHRLPISLVVPVGLVGVSGQMLDESAPSRDIEHLGAPAQPQDRYPGRSRTRYERQLPGVAGGVDTVGLGRQVLSVARSGYIAPACQEQPVQAGQDFFRVGRAQRGEHKREGARSDNGIGVRPLEMLGPTPVVKQGRTGDTDPRLHCRQSRHGCDQG